MKSGCLQIFALWEGAAPPFGFPVGGAFSDEVRRGSDFSPRPAGDCCLKNRRRTSSRLLREICSDEVVGALLGTPTSSCRRVSQTKVRRSQTKSDEVGKRRPRGFLQKEGEDALCANFKAHMYARSEDAIRPCNIADQDVASAAPPAPRNPAKTDTKSAGITAQPARLRERHAAHGFVGVSVGVFAADRGPTP